MADEAPSYIPDDSPPVEGDTGLRELADNKDKETAKDSSYSSECKENTFISSDLLFQLIRKQLNGWKSSVTEKRFDLQSDEMPDTLSTEVLLEKTSNEVVPELRKWRFQQGTRHVEPSLTNSH